MALARARPGPFQQNVASQGVKSVKVVITILERYQVAVPEAWWLSLSFGEPGPQQGCRKYDYLCSGSDVRRAKVTRTMENQIRQQGGIGLLFGASGTISHSRVSRSVCACGPQPGDEYLAGGQGLMRPLSSAP